MALLRVYYPAVAADFIFLGMEVLAGNYKAAKTEKEEGGEKIRFVYDKTAILLTVVLTFFAMVLGMMDYAIQLEGWYLRF